MALAVGLLGAAHGEDDPVALVVAGERRPGGEDEGDRHAEVAHVERRPEEVAEEDHRGDEDGDQDGRVALVLGDFLVHIKNPSDFL